MRRKVLIGGGIIALIALVMAANLWRQSRGEPATVVQVKPVAVADLAVTVEAEGVVEPVERVEVRAPASGALARVAVEEGDRVGKGELLAAYDREGLALARQRAESEVAQARARVAQLEARLSLEQRLRQEEVDRVEELFRRGEATQADVDLARQALANAGRGEALDEQLAAARQALAAAEAAYRQAVEEGRSGEVRSPIAGVVLSREGTRAGQVAKGGVLFVLADLSRVIVKAKVDEVDIGAVSFGDEAEVTSSAYPDQVFRGKVTRIAPQGRKEAGAGSQGNVVTFDVEIGTDNPQGRLRPGMTVDVRIVADRRRGTLPVPAEAVVERRGKKGVFVIEPAAVRGGGAPSRDGGSSGTGVARFRPVETGLANQTQVEVLKGLRPGESFVVGPAGALKNLRDGQRVAGEPTGAAATGPVAR